MAERELWVDVASRDVQDAIDRASDQDQMTWIVLPAMGERRPRRIAAIVPVDWAEWALAADQAIAGRITERASCTHGADCPVSWHPAQLHGDIDGQIERPVAAPVGNFEKVQVRAAPIGTRELGIIDGALDGAKLHSRTAGRQILLDLWKHAYADGAADEQRRGGGVHDHDKNHCCCQHCPHDGHCRCVPRCPSPTRSPE